MHHSSGVIHCDLQNIMSIWISIRTRFWHLSRMAATHAFMDVRNRSRLRVARLVPFACRHDPLFVFLQVHRLYTIGVLLVWGIQWTGFLLPQQVHPLYPVGTPLVYAFRERYCATSRESLHLACAFMVEPIASRFGRLRCGVRCSRMLRYVCHTATLSATKRIRSPPFYPL